MELHVDDDAFVRAPVASVYPRLTDIGGWSRWWPGVTTTPAEATVAAPAATAAAATPDGRSDETWQLSFRAARLRRPLRATARPGQWRHDAGFRLELTGDLEGWSEFWLEDAYGGTVVHHLLVASTSRSRPLRVLRDYRRVLRRGLWQLKDDLQSEVRSAQGVAP